jgi:hypothetical protein
LFEPTSRSNAVCLVDDQSDYKMWSCDPEPMYVLEKDFGWQTQVENVDRMSRFVGLASGVSIVFHLLLFDVLFSFSFPFSEVGLSFSSCFAHAALCI